MDTVHTVLYLLFNEGFHSSEGTTPINPELCREAIHLASLLVDEPRVVNRDTLGLLALTQLHVSRLAARLDGDGRNVPIDQQDRTRWDTGQIGRARALLAVAGAAPPGASGRFLIEARIAEQHCTAATFAQTDWPTIVELYDSLVETTGSPVAELHRAVAIGYAGDPRGAIARVKELRETAPLRTSHLPPAVLAHLSAMMGDRAAANRYAEESTLLGGAARTAVDARAGGAHAGPAPPARAAIMTPADSYMAATVRISTLAPGSWKIGHSRAIAAASS
jgi:predicted RNA polymerase sigma factor